MVTKTQQVLLILGIAAAALFGLAACQQQSEATPVPPTPTTAPVVENTPEPPPPTNTPEPLPTATTAPTATAEPTAVPEPTATATPADVTVDEEGVAFTYGPELEIDKVTIFRLPAQQLGIDGPPVYYNDVPEYIEFVLDTPQGRGMILVQPIRDAEGDFFSTLPAFERQAIAEFEAQLVAEGDGRIDQHQLVYLPFGNGKGLRAISYEFTVPGVEKITNANLYYFYDGFSEDGRYAVSVKMPIDAPGFEDLSPFTQAELDAALADFDTYVTETMAPLDDLTAADFTPDLEALDALVRSLEVDAEASTTVSPLINCTYDAAFVEDVTIPDASVINPGESFQKIWRVRNSGNCAWDSAFTATFIDGASLNWTGFVEVDRVEPGETFDIIVDLQAPEAAGIYEGRWQMIDPLLRPFGIKVYVTIVVPEEPIEPTPTP